LLKPLIAEDIAYTSPDGKLMTGAEAVLADAVSVKWSRAEYTEMKITVYAETAVVTAVFTGKGTDRAGKPVNVHERFTDTWVRSHGHWRCIATHGSDIKN
jgi:ketosteroid isomerase-like protein